MSLRVHLTVKSSNKKTGPMPVSTSSIDTCPPSCILRAQGCYANSGPLSLLWRAVSEGRKGVDWDTFCSQVAGLPDGQLWRHNQAGDLPGIAGILDRARVGQLVAANSGKQGFTFTHYPMAHSNIGAIWAANEGGFCINLSADCLGEADQLAKLGVAPVATLVPEGTDRRTLTPDGRKVVVCPGQVFADATCLTCGLCAQVDRKLIVGFRPHGNQIKSARRVASGLMQRVGCVA